MHSSCTQSQKSIRHARCGMSPPRDCGIAGIWPGACVLTCQWKLLPFWSLCISRQTRTIRTTWVGGTPTVLMVIPDVPVGDGFPRSHHRRMRCGRPISMSRRATQRLSWFVSVFLTVSVSMSALVSLSLLFRDR